ncbi:MarR family winged helix-turn-helix transcriptional regulator [Luedemannella flava]|uniref:MarR family winged helix-turn-helix transcriptional regulator n=1 Tax=Luedemannella flava TaxID=349316 RepID=UPI0031E2182F
MAIPKRTVLDLTGLFAHAGHVLNTRLTAELAEAGLTPRMQCVLIHALERDRTQIELAELAHLDKTTMVSTVDELERAGLAVRRPSETDRRARIVAVTDEGARAAATGQKIVDRVHREVLATLADGDGFLESLASLVDGPLAAPVESPGRTVRRSRPPRT